jgi:hypothetical protein
MLPSPESGWQFGPHFLSDLFYFIFDFGQQVSPCEYDKRCPSWDSGTPK